MDTSKFRGERGAGRRAAGLASHLAADVVLGSEYL